MKERLFLLRADAFKAVTAAASFPRKRISHFSFRFQHTSRRAEKQGQTSDFSTDFLTFCLLICQIIHLTLCSFF
jgi:hypothetical protein